MHEHEENVFTTLVCYVSIITKQNVCFPVPACKRLKHSTHGQVEETLNEEKWLGRYEEDKGFDLELRSTNTQGDLKAYYVQTF